MTTRDTITLTLRPEPGVELHVGLKPVLKRLLRAHRLRCIEVRIATPADLAANQRRMHRAAERRQ